MKSVLLSLLVIIAFMFVASVVLAWLFERACILIARLNTYLRYIYKAKHPKFYRVLVIPYKIVIKWLFRRTPSQ